MVGKDYAQLVTVSRAQYDASKIEAHLRKAGQPVRMQTIVPTEELPNQLRQLDPDLIFCDGQDNGLDVTQIVRQCQQALPGVPVLLLVEGLDGEQLTQALKNRARDCVSPLHLEHLQFVFMRELGVRHLNRQLDEAERAVSSLSNQVEGLITTSQDAVAYLQEGIIVEANPSFAKCFGQQDPLVMAGLPLMDLIGAEQQSQVKKTLSRVSKGKEAEHSLHCEGVKAQGTTFKMELRVRRTEINGEDCLEVFALPLQPAAATPPAAAGATEGDPRFALYAQLTDPKYQDRLPVALYYVVVDDMAGHERRLGFAPAYRISQLLHEFVKGIAPRMEIYPFAASEFVCVLHDTPMAASVELAQRLCKNTQEHMFQSESISSLITVSIGVTEITALGEAEKRFWEARAAARELSASGGNQTRTLIEGAEAAGATPADATWLSRIENGIAQNRFQIGFRGIASLEGDPREYYDAVAYLQGEGEQKHPPEEYLPYAEKAGLTAQIESRLLAQVVATLMLRNREGRQQGLFVSLSGATLHNAESLGPWLVQQAGTGALNGQELVLMFSEKTLVYNVSQANALLQQLSGMPVSLAVEGLAGTLNSTKLLQHVPVRFVRLSPDAGKALINNRDKNHQQVQECVTAARSRGCKIVAAGTADAHSMAMLWQVGVNYVATGS